MCFPRYLHALTAPGLDSRSTPATRSPGEDRLRAELRWRVHRSHTLPEAIKTNQFKAIADVAFGCLGRLSASYTRAGDLE